jgi:hypothetical protein
MPAITTSTRALQRHALRCGVTGRQDTTTPADVRPLASRQLHPRVSVRTTTQREISTSPPTKLLLDGHRACHDAPPEARFARTVVHPVALSVMPSHVARTVRHACKLPPPWPIKGGQPLASRGRQIALTHTLSAFTTILALASIRKPLGPGGPASSPASLVAPLCKYYGATQYSAPSTPLLDVRPWPEPG